eukprot:TRINITY_DN56508_c0_g1_i1.p1 TRINITY_DN56508_c0_g1~~TRINITY_DN56508_c0_g1_i1.p1  ORF type:complete len:595 (-),score=71.14 TRINITY_DN56508_c0_g1_i1:39-1823(-)
MVRLLPWELSAKVGQSVSAPPHVAGSSGSLVGIGGNPGGVATVASGCNACSGSHSGDGGPSVSIPIGSTSSQGPGLGGLSFWGLGSPVTANVATVAGNVTPSASASGLTPRGSQLTGVGSSQQQGQPRQQSPVVELPGARCAARALRRAQLKEQRSIPGVPRAFCANVGSPRSLTPPRRQSTEGQRSAPNLLALGKGNQPSSSRASSAGPPPLSAATLPVGVTRLAALDRSLSARGRHLGPAGIGREAGHTFGATSSDTVEGGPSPPRSASLSRDGSRNVSPARPRAGTWTHQLGRPRVTSWTAYPTPRRSRVRARSDSPQTASGDISSVAVGTTNAPANPVGATSAGVVGVGACSGGPGVGGVRRRPSKPEKPGQTPYASISVAPGISGVGRTTSRNASPIRPMASGTVLGSSSQGPKGNGVGSGGEQATVKHETRQQSSGNADPNPFKLRRFTDAQKGTFGKALREIQAGRKSSCWMWYVIPTPPHIVNNIEKGSRVNRKFALRSDEEAAAYLEFEADGVSLRQNYLEIMIAVRDQLKAGAKAMSLVGHFDGPKLASSAAFFERITRASGDEELHAVLKQVVDLLSSVGNSR